MNQLLTATDYKQERKYEYAYDSAGNIQSEKIYDLFVSSAEPFKTNVYNYGDETWGDLLTSYNGQAITYDEIGNPINYRDGITFSWSKGRQLDSYTKNGETVSYTYDNDGMRLTKTVGGVEYTYIYKNGLLIQETRGNRILDYSYDANGRPRMVRYRIPNQNYDMCYYYALNTRNDVIGLYDQNGSLIVKYNYDVWGKELSVTNQNGVTITSDTHIANFQPFRYRGYYYDRDSGFYYLQSRYYDPLTHRFINADGYVSTGTGILGHNMFACCDNNPVNYFDPTGMCGDPTCISCNPEREADVAKKLKDGWYDTVYPDFKPYYCSPAYNSSTMITQQGKYADYLQYEKKEVHQKISTGGSVNLTVGYDIYIGDEDLSYASIRCFNYSIQGSASVDYVSIKYAVGDYVNDVVEYDMGKCYMVSWLPASSILSTGVNMTIHLDNGSTQKIRNVFTEGDVLA